MHQPVSNRDILKFELKWGHESLRIKKAMAHSLGLAMLYRLLVIDEILEKFPKTAQTP